MGIWHFVFFVLLFISESLFTEDPLQRVSLGVVVREVVVDETPVFFVLLSALLEALRDRFDTVLALLERDGVIEDRLEDTSTCL